MQRLSDHINERLIAWGHREVALDLELGAERTRRHLAIDDNVIEQMTTDPLLKPYTHNRHQQPWRVRATQQVREHDGGDPVLEERARAATRSWRNSLLLRGPPPYRAEQSSLPKVNRIRLDRAASPAPSSDHIGRDFSATDGGADCGSNKTDPIAGGPSDAPEPG